ncbi:uncharacterized protein B0T15DRAFT_528074 [Chaetomium strumarium]|uniref:Uncharacterized protein n=1 Tax=Chaetomium strumarium TaxID=1170767 RepID=A0AAJ0GV35_9PEZI|nr:hypothetical protein B0T15DRAFT_528074 [Chaetomium strumarium]
MRPSTLCIGAGILPGLAAAGCVSSCGSPKCLAAVGADPAVGESFCSSWLSLAPAMTTVTEFETVTSTQVGVETALTTLTLTTGTTTVTGSDVSTVFLKKRAPTITVTDLDPTSSPDPVEAIVSKCASNDNRISRACSCFMSTATLSTVTVVETAVSTAVVEASSTVVTTITTNVEATVSVAAPTVTIPANIVPNGGFEDYTTTGNLLPWIETVTGGNARVEPIYPISVCGPNGDCPGGQVILRIYPPSVGSGYTGIRQTFDGRPSTTYNVSFLYRCLNYDTQTNIQVLYAGALAGSVKCPSGNFIRANGIQFTTDSTGRAEFEVRFFNPTNLPYLYFYTDDFKAIAA